MDDLIFDGGVGRDGDAWPDDAVGDGGIFPDGGIFVDPGTGDGGCGVDVCGGVNLGFFGKGSLAIGFGSA